MKKIILILWWVIMANAVFSQENGATIKQKATDLLRNRVLAEAAWAMKQKPITVTAATSPRSAGGKHDFFSEADYFWPNPANPNGPYINRDGESNPENFVAHRKAMIRFSKIIGALATAYRLTNNERYAKQAMLHLQAWFVNEKTLMHPNLSFAQAVKGVTTGRSWGIIDTIHLMEVAQGILIMQQSKYFDELKLTAIKKWFADYVIWLNTSKNGVAEKLSKNNHSTCWAMQVASFAKLTDNEPMLDSLRWRYKNVLLPNQMAVDGSFPLEMARTKPYGYAIFNLDAMVTLCQILSTDKDNLWQFETSDGKSIFKGIQFLSPFLADKSQWKLKPDIMYWEQWPVAQPFLLFGANQFKRQDWFDIWTKLDHWPTNQEVIRNLPIRYPLIWM